MKIFFIFLTATLVFPYSVKENPPHFSIRSIWPPDNKVTWSKFGDLENVVDPLASDGFFIKIYIKPSYWNAFELLLDYLYQVCGSINPNFTDLFLAHKEKTSRSIWQEWYAEMKPQFDIVDREIESYTRYCGADQLLTDAFNSLDIGRFFLLFADSKFNSDLFISLPKPYKNLTDVWRQEGALFSLAYFRSRPTERYQFLPLASRMLFERDEIIEPITYFYKDRIPDPGVNSGVRLDKISIGDPLLVKDNTNRLISAFQETFSIPDKLLPYISINPDSLNLIVRHDERVLVKIDFLDRSDLNNVISTQTIAVGDNVHF